MTTEKTSAGTTSPHAIIDVATAFWRSKVLLTAVDLGLFAELARTPLTEDGLRERLGLKGPGVEDFLDALVGMGMLERTDGHYRCSELTATYLDPQRPESDITGFLAFLNAGFSWWNKLPEALRDGVRLDFGDALAGHESSSSDGGIAADGYTDDTFAEAYRTPEQVIGFARAMTGYSTGADQALAREVDWSTAHRVVDVGCAQGSLISHLLRTHEHLHGVGFDLPAVGDTFTAHVAAVGVPDRTEFVGGDFRTDPLPRADVVVFGHVLHDWDVETKQVLLRMAYDALPEGGRVVVYESMIDDDRRENVQGLLISLNVRTVSEGGSGCTTAECTEWVRRAGFGEVTALHLDGPEHAVIGRK
jgi:SAM-dependent methyltransferase